MSSAFGDIKDQQEAADVDLSENVAEDVIEYLRGNVVGHEEEGYLMYLSLLTGWAYSPSVHNNVIAKGPPGSGKSLMKNKVENLFDDMDTYTKTDASSNAILDSPEWDYALVAPLDEFDKIDRAIREVLKSSNPEDGGYSKDRNVEDPDAKGGYSPTEVSASANPWVILYAPSSKKGGIDNELEDRALILYFSNDKHTRRGIMRKEFGHEQIDTSHTDREYIYDTHALAARLREHVRDLSVREEYEDEDDPAPTRSGDTLTYMPKWVVYVVEPIFNISEDYSNRVFGIVDNAIRASTLSNYHERPRKEVEVYVDEDSTETITREALVVQPQDVANVMATLPTLLSTTHQLTPIKRHILDAVDATSSITDGDGTTVQDVREWLADNDIPHPTENTLRQKMDELSENYYLQKWENAGGKNGTANVYEIRDDGALQVPNIYDLDRHAARDDVDLEAEEVVDIDPSDPFDGVTDPFRDQPFKETVREFEAEFAGENTEESTDAADFMGGSDEDTTTDDGDGQASLSDVGSDGVDKEAIAEDNSQSISLDPEGKPSNPTEEYVYSVLTERDGEIFAQTADVTQYVGIVENGQSAINVDVSGTAMDPDHELWDGRPDLKDDRVLSESDALRELNDALGELKQKDIIAFDDDGGPPAMERLVVADEDDL